LDFEIPGINLIFLELAKRKKLGNFNFENPVDRWLSFLTEPEKILTMPKFDLSEYPNLMKAVELLDQSNYSEAQLYAYDKHLLAVADINQSRIENFDKGYDEGIEKGKEAGRLEGFNEGKNFTLSILKDLHQGKLSQKEIAEKYSISIEEVNDLSSALK
jgi:predicted transposase/invertase (TIGR01784 family)